jgi:hypothetical protein
MGRSKDNYSNPLLFIGLLVLILAAAYWMDLFEVGGKDYGEGMLFEKRQETSQMELI